MEIEGNKQYRQNTVKRKTTHKESYIHKTSKHHQYQKYRLILILSERTRRICEPVSLNSESENLEYALMDNSYFKEEIRISVQQKRQRQNH